MPDTIFDARARLAKALANPARLQMLDALAKVDELCVCELVELVGLDQTTVSKHLAVLRGAGIVQSRKQGLQVYYQLRTPCIMNFFECADRVLSANRPYVLMTTSKKDSTSRLSALQEFPGTPTAPRIRR